jgi:hypothetical protein
MTMTTVPRRRARASATLLPAAAALAVLLAAAAPRFATAQHKAWPVVPHKTCWDHTLTSANYLDYGRAVAACAKAGDACSGLHDVGCLGTTFRLCDADHAVVNFTNAGGPGPQHCVRAKPEQKAEEQTAASAWIGGRWCSNWCCCANSGGVPNTTDWHGQHCDDTNECASAPCLNGGSCSESGTDPRVNNYRRKYRCECAQNATHLYSGHNCEAVGAKGQSTKCKLSAGVKDTVAATSTQFFYLQFQQALAYLGITLRSSITDFERFCNQVFEREAKGGACGQVYNLWSQPKDGRPASVIATPTLNCAQGGVNENEMYVAFKLCVAPCIGDPTVTCCFVPARRDGLTPAPTHASTRWLLVVARSQWPAALEHQIRNRAPVTPCQAHTDHRRPLRVRRPTSL